MSCSPYDLRDYLFEELTGVQRGEVRLHLKACVPCTSELESLRLTHSALLALRDEEIPQRIGFVSDKVFEPSLLRRWLAGFWTSAARIGFVSAAMLSTAILVHGWAIGQNAHKDAQSAQVTQAEMDRRINDAVAAQVKLQVDARVAAAVTQAVTETEERAQKRTKEMLALAEKRHDFEQAAIRAEFRGELQYLRMKSQVARFSASYSGGGQ
jgi:hypothetical protein